MVILTFQPGGLDEIAESIKQKDDAFDLEVRGFFEFPVMFLVNNINLFEITREEVVMIYHVETGSLEPTVRSVTSPWFSLSILSFALKGLKAVRQVYQGKSIDLELFETGTLLRFRAMDKEVDIYSMLNKKTVIADSLELLHAFENFHSEVRDFLSTEFPHLKEYANWTTWFEEE